MKSKGLFHLYMGDGKGKTTASVGLAVRAVGQGMRVMFVQFLKGRTTGEIEPLQKLGVTVVRSAGVTKFIPDMLSHELADCRSAQQECLDAAKAGAAQCDLLIMDEALGALEMGMLGLDELIGLAQSRPEGLELVMTGRNAPPQLLVLADYVSDIRAVKHPYTKNVGARRGIEY